MPDGRNDTFFEHLAEVTGRGDSSDHAPSRLKSKVYSGLMRYMAQSGPIQSVAETRATHPLCVFEEMFQITPLTGNLGSANFCRVCHARVVGEHIENAPIFWGHCPYVRFQNR